MVDTAKLQPNLRALLKELELTAYGGIPSYLDENDIDAILDCVEKAGYVLTGPVGGL